MAREFTDEQKKAWKEHVKEREDQAKEQIHDLARSFRDTPEQIQEFLTFGAKFYQYSARNLFRRMCSAGGRSHYNVFS